MLPEAVIITSEDPKQLKKKSKRVSQTNSNKDDSIDGIDYSKFELQFCNKAAGNLANEKMELHTTEQLKKSKLLELRLFSVWQSENSKREQSSASQDEILSKYRNKNKFSLLKMMSIHD